MQIVLENGVREKYFNSGIQKSRAWRAALKVVGKKYEAVFLSQNQNMLRGQENGYD